MRNRKYHRRAEVEQQLVMVSQEEPMFFPATGPHHSDEGHDPRAIWLTTEVYPDTISPIIQQIHNINYIDAKKEKEAQLDNQVYTRQPIKLFISSYGGSVIDGLGLIGVIKASKTPIHTYSVGKVMSMGILIAITGHRRFTYPHTTYMIHSLSSVAWGKFAELKESVEEDTRLQQKIDLIITTNTNITQDRLEDVHSRKIDWYFDSEEALILSCVDEVL